MAIKTAEISNFDILDKCHCKMKSGVKVHLLNDPDLDTTDRNQYVNKLDEISHPCHKKGPGLMKEGMPF